MVLVTYLFLSLSSCLSSAHFCLALTTSCSLSLLSLNLTGKAEPNAYILEIHISLEMTMACCAGIFLGFVCTARDDVPFTLYTVITVITPNFAYLMTRMKTSLATFGHVNNLW